MLRQLRWPKLCVKKARSPISFPAAALTPSVPWAIAHAAAELVYQADTTGLKIEKIVHATGSAGAPSCGFACDQRTD